MPRPERVTATPVILGLYGGRIDPLVTDVHVKAKPIDVWQREVPSPVATYRILLGYYTDWPADQNAPGQPRFSAVQHVLAWVVVARHVPEVWAPPPGSPVEINGPATNAEPAGSGRQSVETSTVPPGPPCVFGDAYYAMDATTGRFLGGGTID